ncbi:MAG: hypothetical protein ABFD69_11360 [Candidatus Sumerlaeia bacterium]
MFTNGTTRGICAESAKENSLGQSEAAPQEKCVEITGALKERKKHSTDDRFFRAFSAQHKKMNARRDWV